MTLEENVAEMISYAYNDKFENLESNKQQNLLRWAESIVEYVKST